MNLGVAAADMQAAKQFDLAGEFLDVGELHGEIGMEIRSGDGWGQGAVRDE